MGTRDIAMSKPPIEEKPLYPRSFAHGYKDKFDNYEDNYPSYLGKNYQTPIYNPTYKAPIAGTITIIIGILNSEIGDIADWNSPNYNMNLAESRAIEITYDKLEEMFNKKYTSKYSMSFQTMDDTDSIEITITLTPIKK